MVTSNSDNLTLNKYKMSTTLIRRKSLLSDLESLERIWNAWADCPSSSVAVYGNLPRKVNTDGNFATIEIEVPGVEPSEIKVKIKGGTVCIASPKGNTSIPVGREFDITQASASLKHGLLTVSIPKKDEKVLDILIET